jgi:hypothetical protein
MRTQKSLRKSIVLIVIVCALGVVMAAVFAQAPSPIPAATKKNIPPRPAPAFNGYPFPRSTDAEIADGAAHIVHYEDKNVMFLEVANPPLYDIHMHGHPYASVFTHDSNTGAKNPDAPPAPTTPGGYNSVEDPTSPFNNMGQNDSGPPAGAEWPTCQTAAPQAPHRPYNVNVAPNHFYRIEFLRLDGEDIQKNWKQWYPEMTAPVKPVKDLVPGPALGPKFSDKWPYPIAYDSINAAPNNYKLLYENDKMRLIEVTIRPGETTPMHGSPYPAALAFNAISGDPKLVTDKFLDPSSPLNGQGAAQAGPPKVYNMKVPTCLSTQSRAPHAIHNGGSAPLHYYQMEYKRIDGDGLTAHWREWYPWMQYMQFAR